MVMLLRHGSVRRADYALRLESGWLVEFRICSSRRECRDTVYEVWPKSCLLAHGRKVLLRIRDSCVEVYAQYSNRGRLKWSVLRLFFEKEHDLWEAKWRYDDYDDISKIYYMAREAWNVINEYVGVENTRSAVMLWLKQHPAWEEIIKALES